VLWVSISSYRRKRVKHWLEKGKKMTRHKRPHQQQGTTQKHASSTKHQQNVTRFQDNQKPLNNSFDQLGNELHSAGQRMGSPVEKRRGIQTHVSPNKTYQYQRRYPSTKSAAKSRLQSAQSKVDVQVILSRYAALVFFILWASVALYELVFTGNGSLINMGDKATPVILMAVLLPTKKK